MRPRDGGGPWSVTCWASSLALSSRPSRVRSGCLVRCSCCRPAVDPAKRYSPGEGAPEPEVDHPGRLRRRDRGWDLRDRRRVDPRTDPRWLRDGRQPGRPGRTGEHLRHVRRRGRHLRGPAGDRVRVHRCGLALGVACGLGGLCGGYLGAPLQPRMPEKLLRTLLGLLAISLAVLYAVQAAT